MYYIYRALSTVTTRLSLLVLKLIENCQSFVTMVKHTIFSKSHIKAYKQV